MSGLKRLKNRPILDRLIFYIGHGISQSQALQATLDGLTLLPLLGFASWASKLEPSTAYLLCQVDLAALLGGARLPDCKKLAGIKTPARVMTAASPPPYLHGECALSVGTTLCPSVLVRREGWKTSHLSYTRLFHILSCFLSFLTAKSSALPSLFLEGLGFDSRNSVISVPLYSHSFYLVFSNGSFITLSEGRRCRPGSCLARSNCVRNLLLER
jgi:hypothetical protein